METEFNKGLCDSSFSARPNLYTVLIELALSNLLCLHLHFTVSEQERLSLVSGASLQKVHEERGRAHVRVSSSLQMLKMLHDRKAQVRGGQRGRDYRIDPSLLTLSMCLFPQSDLLLCID